jgi:hypothetical protein
MRRERERGIEKDQDQAIEIPQFRCRNAANSSERADAGPAQPSTRAAEIP